ncbi:MAG: hypothetical protein GX131_00290 [candidate division WS1 bacterium]|nr:hypothetical protein [candidate division WS1 bacterium]
MRAFAAMLSVLLALPALGGEILLQGNDPLAVVALNPETASMASGEGAAGGLDEGLDGDAWYYQVSVTDVGKRFYKTPDSIGLLVDTTELRGPLTIEIGVFMSTYGSGNGRALWDGEAILDINAYGRPEERLVIASATVEPAPGVHELRIEDQVGEGTYVTIDAIRLSGEGELALVDANGLPIALESPSVPAAEATALAQTLDALPNVAKLREGVTWHATENFTIPTWSAQAALDGNPDDGDYWAGGTPAPHALLVEYPAPITFDTCRIRWMGEGVNRGVVYGLEAWDPAQERWSLVFQDPHNLLADPIYLFEPITTTRVRFTVLELTGEQRTLMRAFELYDRAGGGA